MKAIVAEYFIWNCFASKLACVCPCSHRNYLNHVSLRVKRMRDFQTHFFVLDIRVAKPPVSASYKAARVEFCWALLKNICSTICYNDWRFAGTQTRYQVKEFPNGGALLRIEPVKPGRDDATYECVAENGVGDAVSAEATLAVFEGKCRWNF